MNEKNRLYESSQFLFFVSVDYFRAMKKYARRFKDLDHFILLFSLLLAIVLPLFNYFESLHSMVPDFNLLLLILSGYSVAYSLDKRITVAKGIAALAFLAVLLRFIDVGFDPVEESRIGGIFIIVFLFLLTQSLIRNILSLRYVGVELIVDAMNGYLLLGLSGSLMTAILDYFIANAYSVDIDGLYGSFGYLYYSFVTLTTLGYGDIYPTKPISMSLAILISLAGVLYLAFLVATIVSKASEHKKV